MLNFESYRKWPIQSFCYFSIVFLCVLCDLCCIILILIFLGILRYIFFCIVHYRLRVSVIQTLLTKQLSV